MGKVYRVNDKLELLELVDFKEADEKEIPQAVSFVIVERKDGKVFLQYRPKGRVRNPLKFTSSASGHVDEDEDYLEAAGRELREELGITVEQNKLKLIGTVPKFTHRGKVYLVRTDSPLFPDPGEVDAAGSGWFSLAEVKEMVEKTPEKFTRGGLQAFQAYLKHSHVGKA
ncbi:Isopentenyl-diphosphate Delta-isomerase [Candidatus Gugararchaeum adminiculabundum]|nr:Isopentenyl-diphosphate Delta-isomerase [Candidatus Gugararchaeum adminiculabundum]